MKRDDGTSWSSRVAFGSVIGALFGLLMHLVGVGNTLLEGAVLGLAAAVLLSLYSSPLKFFGLIRTSAPSDEDPPP
jgi:hypothetical protein